MSDQGDQIINNICKISALYQQILLHLLDNQINLVPKQLINNNQIIDLFNKINSEILAKPQELIEHNMQYIVDVGNLISSTLDRFFKNTFEGADLTHKTKTDKRFKNQAFENNVYFNFVKEFYLLTTDTIKGSLKNYNISASESHYLEFVTKEFINTLSPNNFIWTNPDVLQKGLETNWQNLSDGLDNFLGDLKTSKDIFKISTVNEKNFHIGQNIAQTKGKVIFQNDLIELIFYEPEKTTYELPLLVVPPWINKYYILDLSSHNSFVSYLNKANLKIFMISWRNVNKQDANLNFQDYHNSGVAAACEYLALLGYKQFNAAGYCIGGTLLAMSLSYFKKNNLDYIKSASFIASLFDFNDVGDLKLFVNDSTIDQLENLVSKQGYLDGRYLFNGFSILRSNDLIWSFIINNYLLGKVPPSFDILYWNGDTTNLPSQMFIYYLRNMYVNNLLIKANSLSINSTPIDLNDIDIPVFFLAAAGDHIVPWQSVYKAINLFKSFDKSFCLTDSGHVAGVINPPLLKQYHHRVNINLTLDSKAWFKDSIKIEHSWWISWLKWLQIKSGLLAKDDKYDTCHSLRPAPGDYIKK